MKEELAPDQRDLIACLRGFAIISIVFGHVGGYWALMPYSSYMHVTGSSFFFFLSGAVLYYCYLRSESLKSYYVKRLSMLLIPYYAVCILSIFVYFFVEKSFPLYDFENLMAWILIRPSNSRLLAIPGG